MKETAPGDPERPARRLLRPHRLLSDEALARRASQGDRRAFEAIYHRYHQSLYGFCLAATGDPQDAQEALQNTMLKVLRGLPGEQRQIRLKPWLYRIARNESVETIRRRRDTAELQADLSPSPFEISTSAETRERLRGLLRDLEELPERQRAALLMREMAGLDFEQIAEALDTSARAVRQTVYEARLGLRKMEAGREMDCAAVERELSDADGRVVRRRDLRAHLRGCPSCRAFRESIVARRSGYASIAPLPVALSAGLLKGVLGGGAAGTAASSVAAKSAATVAVVAVLGGAAADRGGVVDLPVPGGGNEPVPAETNVGPADVWQPGGEVSKGVAAGAGKAAMRRAKVAIRRRAIAPARSVPPGALREDGEDGAPAQVGLRLRPDRPLPGKGGKKQPASRAAPPGRKGSGRERAAERPPAKEPRLDVRRPRGKAAVPARESPPKSLDRGPTQGPAAAELETPAP